MLRGFRSLKKQAKATSETVFLHSSQTAAQMSERELFAIVFTSRNLKNKNCIYNIDIQYSIDYNTREKRFQQFFQKKVNKIQKNLENLTILCYYHSHREGNNVFFCNRRFIQQNEAPRSKIVLTTVYPTIEKDLINIRVWRSWERGWFGTIRPQVRSLSLGPQKRPKAETYSPLQVFFYCCLSVFFPILESSRFFEHSFVTHFS